MNKRIYIIGFLVLYLTGFLIYIYFFSVPKYKSLTKNFLLSSCYSYKFTPGTGYKNNPPSIYYTYEVKGKEYSSNFQLNSILSMDIKKYLIFKTFPVAVDKEDHSNSAILIEPKTFKDFKLDFPDSLNWILPYIRN